LVPRSFFPSSSCKPLRLSRFSIPRRPGVLSPTQHPSVPSVAGCPFLFPFFLSSVRLTKIQSLTRFRFPRCSERFPPPDPDTNIGTDDPFPFFPPFSPFQANSQKVATLPIVFTLFPNACIIFPYGFLRYWFVERAESFSPDTVRVPENNFTSVVWSPPSRI